MARVKTARITRKKHKKVLKQAKGYFGAKGYRFRNANQAVLKSLSYAYVGRKDKKSENMRHRTEFPVLSFMKNCGEQHHKRTWFGSGNMFYGFL